MTATTSKELRNDTREMLQELIRIPKNQLPMGRLLADTFLDGSMRTMDALQIKEQEEK